MSKELIERVRLFIGEGIENEIVSRIEELESERDDFGDGLAQVKLKNAMLIKERDQLREQVKMLSGVVERCNKYAKETLPTGYLAALTDEAISATEPKL